MRIALVTYALNVGGMETFMLDLGIALRAIGHEVTYIETESIGPWHDRARDLGFDVIAVLPSLWQSRRHHVARLAPVLEGYDALILNHSAAAQTALGELRRPRVIVSVLHNVFDEIFRIGLANAANVDYISCVGSAVMEKARSHGAATEQLVHIPNGVIVPEEWPKQHSQNRTGQPLRLIFVGRVENVQKGVLDLPAILANAIARGASLSFDIVGDGCDREMLEQMLKRLCPQLPVVCHGRKDNVETIRCIEQADVLLMPSRFEGFPITLLEAMAHGVVPVASYLPGITDDAVTNGVDGLLPPVGDIEAFAGAILRLTDAELRRHTSRAAWNKAREKFQQATMVGRYTELLQRPLRTSTKNQTSLDEVGREMFGAAWASPIVLVKIWRAFRERRLLSIIQRRLRLAFLR